MVHEEKGFGGIAVAQPVEGNIGNRVVGVQGGVSFTENFSDHLAAIVGPFAGVLVEELRIEIGALAGKHAVVVEAGRFDVKVPLADHGGLIAEFRHHVGQHDALRRDRVGERAHPIDV